jgi:hypothetical protein
VPSSIASVPEFQRRLEQARQRASALAASMPQDPQLASIAKQLDALHGFTQGGRQPTQDEKDRLNFGLLASRFMSDIDDDLAGELYELASFVTYW